MLQNNCPVETFYVQINLKARFVTLHIKVLIISFDIKIVLQISY